MSFRAHSATRFSKEGELGMDDMPSEAYQCHSKGCANGHMSTFYAAPRDWFAEKGLSTPKRCPACRDWCKNQIDEATYCSQCGRYMRLSARYKISHHKMTGPWQKPTKCIKCQEGKPPKQAIGKPPGRERILPPHQEEDEDFSDINDGIVPQVRDIDINVANYQELDGDGERTQQQHVERHMKGSPLEDKARSKSGFAGKDDSFEELLAYVAGVFAAADPADTREYLERGNIVRLTLFDSGHIERTVITASPGPHGHRVITTFDNQTIAWALGRYGSKSAKNVQ